MDCYNDPRFANYISLPMQVFVETQRLLLGEIVPEDVEGMFELDSDREVHRFLGNQPVSSRVESMAIINMIRQQYKDNGIGRWAVIDKLSH